MYLVVYVQLQSDLSINPITKMLGCTFNCFENDALKFSSKLGVRMAYWR